MSSGTCSNIHENTSTEWHYSSPSEAERFLKLQLRLNQVLELLAKGESPKKVVDILLTNIEEIIPGMTASALTLSSDGRSLYHCAGPSLPEEYRDAIDGFEIGPDIGSCGTAAYHGERVIVEDIIESPLWNDYRELALRFNFRACWSEPIISSDKKVLGTFAMYYEEPRTPTNFELHVIEVAAHIAGLELERRRADKEAKALEKQLLQAQKMNAIGKLAGGIAHDLNNTLSAIDGHLQLIKLQTDLPNEVNESVDLALEGCERGANLIRQILGFSRQGKYHPSPVDTQELVRDTLDFLSKLIRGDVRLTNKIGTEKLILNIDKFQIQQVLTNLIINAQDAMPDGGEINFECSKKEIADPKIYNERAKAGNYIVLKVRDTGSGIHTQDLDKIFEPFFTTKKEGEGVGLGLSMAYGILQNHGGWIEAHSTVGQGSVFTIYLPEFIKSTDKKAERKNPQQETPSFSRAPHILVVDDEPPLVELAEAFLNRAGFTVTGFTNPKKAIEWYRENEKSVSLTILDMKMPEMNGVECFRAIRRCNSTAKIILVSGYSKDFTVQKLLKEGALAFFQKPVDFKVLTRWISNLLGQNMQAAI